MDISKLPRLSKTDTPAEATPAAGDASPVDAPPPPPFVTASAWCPNCGAPLTPGSRFCNSCGGRLGAGNAAPPGAGFEAWMGIGIGLFLLFIAPMGIQYWSATLTGRTFAPYDHPETVGQKVDFTRWVDQSTGAITDIRYRDTIGFWSDTAVTAFALVLILDGIVLAFARRPGLIAIMLGLTVLTTLLNLAYVVGTFRSHGFPPISFIAILIGGFMCYQQWDVLRSLRATAPRTSRQAA